jgi:hypothetical protein
MSRLSTIAAIALLAASCSGRTQRASTASPSGEVTLHVYNLHLDPQNQEQGADRIRVGVHASSGNVRAMIVLGKSKAGTVEVCRLATVAGGPAPGRCTPAGVQPVAVPSEAIEVHAKDAPVDIDEISVSYPSEDRRTEIVLETLPPKPDQIVCKDNACNPFLELTPRRSGRLTVSVKWEGIATGRLSLLSGAMVARDYSASGKPYDVLASSAFASDVKPANLSVTSQVQSSEVAVVLENEGAREIRNPRLVIQWP